MFEFDNSYARLGSPFCLPQSPAPVREPQLVKFNEALARELDPQFELPDPAYIAAVFSGNRLPPGTTPVAMAYSGHQFGQFVPLLGDGRAVLLGEVVDANGMRRDIHLKGAGRTPFSRGGDGLAALGPVLREYVVSEAMNALGIATTRSLAAVTTGEPVFRETVLPGAVLTRVAASHIRVGTFQFFAARGDAVSLRKLADHVIERHYPDLSGSDQPYVALLQRIIEKQAALVASWMSIGFIHGVMNTDNMTVSGETIDYGPCAFMDTFDPAEVFSSIDHYGRYAYGNQPAVAQWNLARLAEAMLDILTPDADQAVKLANELVIGFARQYQNFWLERMRQKIGLFSQEEGDRELIEALLASMHKNSADFTLTFRYLSDTVADHNKETALRGLFANPQDCDEWLAIWKERLQRDGGSSAQRHKAMLSVNPLFIPRNHRVEAIIAAAVERQDFAPFEELLTVLSRPYEMQEQFLHYANPPEPHEVVQQTFCGT